jgi:hypothetical protein
MIIMLRPDHAGPLMPPTGQRWHPAAYDEAFGLTMLAACSSGIATGANNRELKPRDGFLMVVLVWTVLPAFAACPTCCTWG